MTKTESHKADQLLKSGQHLVLEVTPNLTLRSRIYCVLTSERKLKIAAPTRDGRIRPIPTKTRFQVDFCAELAGVLCRFRFPSELLGYRKESEILYSAVITYPERLNLLERREFFRLRVTLQGCLRPASRDGTIRFVTRDLSAGGALILSDRYLSEDTPVQARLFIWDQGPTEIQAKVVRVMGKDLYGRWMIGIQFQHMDLQVERNLTKFLFQSHRRHLKEMAKLG